MSYTEEFGNGCCIVRQGDTVNIEHDCDCNGGKPCCRTAVDGKMFREAMGRLLDDTPRGLDGRKLHHGTKELECWNCGRGVVVPDHVAKVERCHYCK